MKLFLNFVNGILIYLVGGWSLLAPDWQAWVLALSFILSMEIIEYLAVEQTKEKLRNRITPILDRMESHLGNRTR